MNEGLLSTADNSVPISPGGGLIGGWFQDG